MGIDLRWHLFGAPFVFVFHFGSGLSSHLASASASGSRARTRPPLSENFARSEISSREHIVFIFKPPLSFVFFSLFLSVSYPLSFTDVHETLTNFISFPSFCPCPCGARYQLVTPTLPSTVDSLSSHKPRRRSSSTRRRGASTKRAPSGSRRLSASITPSLVELRRLRRLPPLERVVLVLVVRRGRDRGDVGLVRIALRSRRERAWAPLSSWILRARRTTARVSRTGSEFAPSPPFLCGRRTEPQPRQWRLPSTAKELDTRQTRRLHGEGTAGFKTQDKTRRLSFFDGRTLPFSSPHPAPARNDVALGPAPLCSFFDPVIIAFNPFLFYPLTIILSGLE